MRNLTGRLVVLFVCIVCTTEARSADKYLSLTEVFKKHNDFPFKLLADKPVSHFQLSVEVVKEDKPSTIDLMKKSAMMHGILRSFIHTQLDTVRLTVVPVQFDPSTNRSSVLSKQSASLIANRKVTLKILNTRSKVNQFDDLVENQRVGTMIFSDSYTKLALKFVYDDFLDLVIADLQKEEPKVQQNINDSAAILDTRKKIEQQAAAAASKLKLIKKFIQLNKEEIARRWINELVKDYPATDAAVEAKEILNELE